MGWHMLFYEKKHYANKFRMTLDGSKISQEMPKWADVEKIVLCTHAGNEKDASFSTTRPNIHDSHGTQKMTTLRRGFSTVG
eukprot:9105194-Pyramimonas_sp.AAC.4